MFYNLDIALFSFLNRFAGQSKDFDQFMVFAGGSGILKGGALLAVLWWMWGKGRDHNNQQDREFFVATFVGSLIAAFTGRFLTLVLPFRLRPGYDPLISSLIPAGVEPDVLYRGWSSFPSDHAVLLCSLVAGIILAHRIVGFACLAYVFIVVGIPRVYLGMHYPTDFIAGAIIGMAIGLIVNQKSLRAMIGRPILGLHTRYPGLFYAIFFLISIQIVTMFADFRVLVMSLLKLFGIRLAL